ncbi:MAG: homoserine O-acetyltransferase [Pseudomonadota bacterium]|nr:homoserine O-acetyltransferase [Pseudomonadota bacterium]MDE3037810.1 homoserine O-acetyltransferase [Pseudomonadota bacterium]
MSATFATSFFGANYREVEIGQIVHLARKKPFTLECGVEVTNFPLAFQTYGFLNASRSNAILVCHALSGDQYVCGDHPVTGKPGWWDRMVGPEKPIDTNRFFVICANVVGSCMGSFGPKEINPDTGRPYGLAFPFITVGDMVRSQALLLDYLGIEKLFCVIGGSMGGMQALDWATRFPNRVFSAVPIATATRQSAQNIAFHEIGRQAIMADPDWCGGDYIAERKYPAKGLAVARMAAHVTYLSQDALQEKFGRHLQDRDKYSFGFDADFRVESYLRHQGVSFVERFDANSYLYLTRAASYFDLTEGGAHTLADVFNGTKVRWCVVSFSSDWLYAPAESRNLVRALNAVAADVSFTDIESEHGHDSFLLDVPQFDATIRGFLEGSASLYGVG